MDAKSAISDGIRSDFGDLLRRFEETNSVRFEEYAKLWTRMKLSYIFSGHENGVELSNFTNECLTTALAYCLPPHSFQWRTGGLYLLYSIYFKQPDTGTSRAKIRVTKTQWEEILAFVQSVVEEQHHDIHFIFLKLKQHNAFNFVACPKNMAHFLINTKDGDPSRLTAQSALKYLFNDVICGDFGAIHRAYVDIKKELYPLDGNLCLVRENLFDSACERIEAHERHRLAVVEKGNTDGKRVKRGEIRNSRRRRGGEDEFLDESSAVKKPRRKKRKVRSEKEDSDEEMEVEELVTNKTEFGDNEEELFLSMPTFNSLFG